MPDSPGIQSGYNDDLKSLHDCIRAVLRQTKAKSPDVIASLVIQEIWARFSGVSIYVPKVEAQNRFVRDAAIRKEYQDSAPVRWLAKRYGLTVQTVYAILNKKPG